MSAAKEGTRIAASRGLLAAAEAMLPEIRAMADEVDAARRLPEPLVERLAAAGFFHLMTGREWGGVEADPVTAAKVIETLSTASPSVGWVAMILSSASYWAVRMLPEESSRAIFSADLSGGIQPAVLAGTLVPHGRAVRVEGGWRVSGQWPFASGCHHANWLPSASWLYSEENGENSPILDANGAPEWRVFHVPAARCVILDTWHTTGLRGTGSHDYTMEDVFVTDGFVRRHSLREAATLPGPQYAYAAFAVPVLSAVALGAARGAVDALVELFGSKTDRRSGRPVAGGFHQQADLGAAEALAGSSRAYLYDMTGRVWERISAGEEVPQELRAGLRLACTHAVSASVEAVDLAHRAAGASSIYISSPLDRFFRDVHTVAAHAFVRQATLADGGQLLLGQEPAFRVF